MKEDKIIELFLAENDLLKKKIEILENDIKISKAVATKLEKEVEEQDAEIGKLKAEIDARDVAIMRLDHEKDRLSEELDHQKAIASAELDSMHKLGDDYAKVLEDEQQHIREAKMEAVDKFRDALMDKFLRLCFYNDFYKLNLEKIADTVNEIYDKCIDYMNGECDEK